MSTPAVIRLLENSALKCGKESLRNRCYQTEAVKTLSIANFSQVLEALDYIQKNSNDSYHDFLHYLSRTEFDKRENLSTLLLDCTPVFFNACYHGALSGYIEASDLAGKDINTQRSHITRACETLKNHKAPGFYHQCIHGLGHGFMLLSNNELPWSLEACDYLESSDASTCYGGVFMENFPSSSTSDHPSKYLKDSDPVYPCNILAEKYLGVCYTFLTNHFIYLSAFDWSRAAGMCSLVPKDYRGNCYMTIGTSGGGNFVDINQKKQICDLLPLEARIYCVKGVVLAYADRFGGTKRMYGMYDFCSEVDSSYQQECFGQANVVLSSWGEKKEAMLANCFQVDQPQVRVVCERSVSY